MKYSESVLSSARTITLRSPEREPKLYFPFAINYSYERCFVRSRRARFNTVDPDNELEREVSRNSRDSGNSSIKVTKASLVGLLTRTVDNFSSITNFYSIHNVSLTRLNAKSDVHDPLNFYRGENLDF